MKYLVIIVLSFLIASAISVAGVFIFQSMDVINTAETDMMNLPYGIAIAFNLLLAFGTFPVFLNLKPWVKGSFMLSALSFFVLPLVITLYLALSLEEEAWTGVIFCIPYLIILLAFFVGFRRENEV